MKYLDELILPHDVLATRGNTHIAVAGVEFDSRKIEKDYCYVAIKGFVRDGVDFVANGWIF